VDYGIYGIKSEIMKNKIIHLLLNIFIFLIKDKPELIDWSEIYRKLKTVFPKYFDLYFSQEGEDMLLKRVMKTNKRNGFYVDIGAFHPIRFSNTYHFYLQGWKGINIDPLPGSKIVFDSVRPRDINLEIAVGEFETTMDYYSFKESAFNTFSKTRAEEVDGNLCTLISVNPCEVKRLETILDIYSQPNRVIDFLSIDVEGLEIPVLKSNNWSKYKPLYILVEDIESKIINIQDSEVYHFLHEHKYRLLAKTKFTMLFEYIAQNKDTSNIFTNKEYQLVK
jgi:FkbM family methyltransferase